MSDTKLIISIIIMVAVTFTTRALPFLIFGSKGNRPAPIILFVGKYLPPALISAIIIYCYKDIKLTTAPFGLPELTAGILVALLQLRFKNTMLSIFAGTIFYMVVLRLI